MKLRRVLPSALALLALAAAPRPAAAQAGDYLALGDSYAYGFTTIGDLLAHGQSDGYQGYVAPFAQFLGIPEASVFNLAIPGETLTSFSQPHDPSQLPTDPFSDYAFANLNYGNPQYFLSPTQLPYGASQAALLGGVLAHENGAGHTVRDITVQLGGNDLIGLALTPAFQAAGPAGKQALVQTALATFNTNYIGLLGALKQDAPAASIFVVGYFDAFTPLGTGNPPGQTNDPFNGLGSVLLPELNAGLAADAAAAGVKYVDISRAFQGHEEAYSEDTQFLDNPALPNSNALPNYHPNALGYAVIAQQLDQATAVPEPAPCFLLTLGLPVIGLVARRRKA